MATSSCHTKKVAGKCENILTHFVCFQSQPFGLFETKRKRKTLVILRSLLVAGAGFEPATFGL